MNRPAPWRWAALLAALCALVPNAVGLAQEHPPPQQRETQEDYDYDEAENAFLGGPDPPCMLPCVLAMVVLCLAALVVALALGLAVTGVVLVVVFVLAVACLVLAAWLALQGLWLAAAVALVPAALATWAVVARRPSTGAPGGPSDGARGRP